MKLIIDARESGTSTGRYIDKLVENLAQLKPQFEIGVLTKPARVGALATSAPSFRVEPANFQEFGLAEQLGYKSFLKSLRADLVHFGMVQQPIFYKGPSITTIHDLTTARFSNPTKNPAVFKFKQAVYRRVIKRVAKKSVFVVTPSRYVKDDLINFSGVDEDKVFVTYEAADKISAPAIIVDGVAADNFIMYVGRPLPHKNLTRLIDAFADLQQQRPGLQLVLAGKKDGIYLRFEKQIKKRGLKNVIFTDFVSEGQLRWLYENASAYVFPSLSEGFGLPGLEAMVHGAPVISSNATCLPEIYDDAAHYFDPTDTADIAAKISEVLDNPDLRKKLIEKGYQQAAKYSWRYMAEQTLEIYKKALGLGS